MTPWVTRLIIANVALFLVQRSGMIPPVPMPELRALMPGAEYWLAFIPARVLVHPWTLVSYMFLHGGFGHLFFNMLMLFFFGPRAEVKLGGRSFLWLYAISGVTGAVLHLASQWGSPIPMLGASGAVYGVMLAFAFYWPRERIYIWGILPIESRVLIIALTAMNLFFGMSGGGNVAYFAHLGGFAGAFAYLRFREHASATRKWQEQVRPIKPSGHGGNHSDVERWTRIRPEELHPVNRDEVERLLEKVRHHGASSLSPTERDCLNRFTPIH